MRFDDNDRISSNIENQRGSGGGGFGGGGGLGGGAGMIMGLVASRFGIGGVLVLLLVMFLFGGLGSLTGGGGSQVAGGPQFQGKSAAETCASDASTRFTCQVYSSTERVWAELFQAQGQTFDPPKLVFYDRNGQSGCGPAQSAMGPFYCPADQGIYIDTSFFQELSQRFGAPGDFAQAYVVAHEMGHHIQTISGINDRVRGAQQGAREAQSNQLQVRMELQADCLAGVWAARERQRLEPGDLEEGARAAAAIGDDTLQEAAGRRPVPESFTHGTSAQRQAALRRGFDAGSPDACSSFMEGV